MRPLLICTSLAALSALVGCKPASLTESASEPQDVLLSTIQASVTDTGTERVVIRLTWSEQVPTGQEPLEARVYVSNDAISLEARPAWLAGPDGEVDYQATLAVPITDWLQGCWQAQYRVPSVIFTGPIECLNGG